MTRVFISYSHDSDAHRQRVLALSDRLRADGLDCQIDQYINGFPPEGWQRWMETQVEDADFVLLVCTPDYLKRFRGLEADGGRGVNFEGVVISQTFYEEYYRNTKFVPVMPEDGEWADVPLPLKGFSVFRMVSEYEGLYRFLTDQPAVEVPPLGKVIKLGQKRGVLDSSFSQLSVIQFENVEKILSGFFQDLTLRIRQKDEQIEQLTQQLAKLQEERQAALTENKLNQQSDPDSRLLIAEKIALDNFDLQKAVDLRSQYRLESYDDREGEVLTLRLDSNQSLAQAWIGFIFIMFATLFAGGFVLWTSGNETSGDCSPVLVENITESNRDYRIAELPCEEQNAQ